MALLPTEEYPTPVVLVPGSLEFPPSVRQLSTLSLRLRRKPSSIGSWSCPMRINVRSALGAMRNPLQSKVKRFIYHNSLDNRFSCLLFFPSARKLLSITLSVMEAIKKALSVSLWKRIRRQSRGCRPGKKDLLFATSKRRCLCSCREENVFICPGFAAFR